MTREREANDMTIMEQIQHDVDLRRPDIDPEVFATALAVQHLVLLLVHGGSEDGHPDADEAIDPFLLEAFVGRAVMAAQGTGRFLEEWRTLQRLFPPLKHAWEHGQALFQQDFTRAKRSQEVMEYFSQIDFASSCFASCAATKAYPDDHARQAWVRNGYMLAWRH